MKLSKIVSLLVIFVMLNSCASSYHKINPNNLSYNSNDTKNGVTLDYKYDLLSKKYSKKETKKGVKVIAIKISNNSQSDIIFGKNFKLVYNNGNELIIMNNDKVFKSLKQNTISYLFYLLLTPLNLTVSSGSQSTSTPIGFIIGPGLAGGNMLVAGSANKKFKNELLEFNLQGVTIKKGETKSGLIGIKSDNYDAIKIKMK